MYKNLSVPLVVQIELTERCPNQCLHCYNYWRHGSDSLANIATLSLQQIDRIMSELERSKVFGVVITGGEPFLDKAGLFHILDHAEEKGFLFVTINSSLLGMTEADAKRLSRYRCLKGIVASIMGPSEKIHDYISNHSGSFQKTVAGVRMLGDFHVSVSANMVVSRLNKSYIEQTAMLCKELGAKIFNATRATSPINCPDFGPYALDLAEFRSYLSTLGKVGRQNNIPVGVFTVYPFCGVRDFSKYFMTGVRRCPAGITVVAISSRGELRACTHLHGEVGSLLSESLPTLWNKLISWRDGSLLPATCKSCKALGICGGGCRADAQVVNGSLCANDPLMSEEDVDIAIREYQRLMAENQFNAEIPPLLIVNPDLRWRPESFGSVCFLDDQCAGIFNADTTELIFKELAGKVNQKTTLMEMLPEQFLRELCGKHILVPA
jgi:AdoMet-dependent heme synthase